ncbi:MAG: metalloregulator ArsR/SmtB family transcription factor [Betaproteobacteria bacterium]|nr:metalloregulator ArsR/SmtB family transcription factor [Betaproteobacteria bacterium]
MRDTLFEQVSRIGKALASPKRLELIDLLCQGEKTVEALAEGARCSVKLASAHLKALRQARLVEARREGKYAFYHLADAHVADVWIHLRALAEERLLELQTALRSMTASDKDVVGTDRSTLLRQASRGEVIVIDVRPVEEFEAGHLPRARSLPLTELRARLRELPKDKPIVAYCRGPYCLMSSEAVALLKKRGFRAAKLADGVAEWRAHGLPLET